MGRSERPGPRAAPPCSAPAQAQRLPSSASPSHVTPAGGSRSRSHCPLHGAAWSRPGRWGGSLCTWPPPTGTQAGVLLVCAVGCEAQACAVAEFTHAGRSLCRPGAFPCRGHGRGPCPPGLTPLPSLRKQTSLSAPTGPQNGTKAIGRDCRVHGRGQSPWPSTRLPHLATEALGDMARPPSPTSSGRACRG